jgi:hypothetical protein
MRVARNFSARIDGIRSGSETVRLADGIDARAVVFTLRNGEREMLITNLGNIPRKEYLKKPHFHHNHKSNC